MEHDHPGPGRVPRRKWEWILIVLLLLVAGTIWLGTYKGTHAGSIAVATIGTGEQQQQIEMNLDQDRIVEIQAKLPVFLEIKQGKIRFIKSSCPDHDCERFGWLSRQGEWAACLPAGVTLTIQDG